MWSFDFNPFFPEGNDWCGILNKGKIRNAVFVKWSNLYSAAVCKTFYHIIGSDNKAELIFKIYRTVTIQILIYLVDVGIKCIERPCAVSNNVMNRCAVRSFQRLVLAKRKQYRRLL